MADKKNGSKVAAGTEAAGKKHDSNGGVAAAKTTVGGMTKMDAVKKAMEKLGPDAMPVAIKDHLKRQYGIEISADVVSNYKKQLKTKAAGGSQATTSADKPDAPAVPVATPPGTAAPAVNETKAAGGAEPAPTGGAAKTSQAGGEAAGQGKKPKITKTEAVKRALAALGEEATRTDIQSHVRKKYGLEMTLDHISNCKGELVKRAAAEGAQTAAPAKRASTPIPHAASPAPGVPASRTEGSNGLAGDSILLEDVLVAKDLLDRVGADRLRTLLDGLAK